MFALHLPASNLSRVALTLSLFMASFPAALGARTIELAQPAGIPTAESCAAIYKFNASKLAEISREHDNCLKRPGSGFSSTQRDCPRDECQNIHRLRDHIQSEIQMINRLCRERSSKQPTSPSSSGTEGRIKEGMRLGKLLEAPFSYDTSDRNDGTGGYTVSDLASARRELATLLGSGKSPEAAMLDYLFASVSMAPISKSHPANALRSGLRMRLKREFSKIWDQLDHSLSDLEAGKNAIRDLSKTQFRATPIRIGASEPVVKAGGKSTNPDCRILNNVVTSSQLMDQDMDEWVELSKKCGKL